MFDIFVFPIFFFIHKTEKKNKPNKQTKRKPKNKQIENLHSTLSLVCMCVIVCQSNLSMNAHKIKTICKNEKYKTKHHTQIYKLCMWKGFQIYPPPTTPPEPAPPDHHHIGPSSMMRPYKGNMVSASQSSLDDITCKWKY